MAKSILTLKNWYIYLTNDGKYSTNVEEFNTLLEAEEALYQIYCNEDRLTEGY